MERLYLHIVNRFQNHPNFKIFKILYIKIGSADSSLTQLIEIKK